MATFPHKLVGVLLKDSEFSDITFVIDGEQLKLHKNILAASCVYFKTLLFGNTNESKQSVIHLKQTPLKLFKGIVEFIYTGVLVENEYTQAEYIGLLTLAHEYQLQELIDYLSPKIKLDDDLMTAINCLEFAAFCLECNVSELKDRCLKKIDRHVSEICEPNFFKKLPASVVIEITKRDTFGIEELKLFQLLKLWKSVNVHDISNAFHNIRLNLISPEDFAKHVQPSTFLNSDDYVNCLRHQLPRRIGSQGNIKKIMIFLNHETKAYFPHDIVDDAVHLCTNTYISVELEKAAAVSKMTFDVLPYTNCSYEIRVQNPYKTVKRSGNIQQSGALTQTQKFFMPYTGKPASIITFHCDNGYITIPLRSIALELS